MVVKRQCSFCAAEIEPGTGTMFVKRDGSVFHFCTSSCRKQQLHLGRVGHRLKWTRAHALKRAADRSAAAARPAAVPRPTRVRRAAPAPSAPASALPAEAPAPVEAPTPAPAAEAKAKKPVSKPPSKPRTRAKKPAVDASETKG
jgi:large subunit ribosomal protein L24e